VEWQELRLAQEVTGGYADQARPLEDLLRDAVAARAKEALPIVIWIYDLEDEKTNQSIETKIFCDEKVGLALKRFICLKGNLEGIPDRELVKDLRRRAPVFYLYDPAGKPFDTLEGKSATSRSRFYGLVEKLWGASFDVRLRDFAKQMGDILDRVDKLETQKQLLAAKKARAADNPRKLAALKDDEEELAKEEKAILDDEAAILASCKRKAEFESPPEAAQK
jgi:hypothetical protein